jgi:hypothetical protein
MFSITLFLAILSIASCKVSSNCRTTFLNGVLRAHNRYRVLHNVPEMKLSASINKIAQNYADSQENEEFLNHSNEPGYGENIGFLKFKNCPSMLKKYTVASSKKANCSGNVYFYNYKIKFIQKILQIKVMVNIL